MFSILNVKLTFGPYHVIPLELKELCFLCIACTSLALLTFKYLLHYINREPSIMLKDISSSAGGLIAVSYDMFYILLYRNDFCRMLRCVCPPSKHS